MLKRDGITIARRTVAEIPGGTRDTITNTAKKIGATKKEDI